MSQNTIRGKRNGELSRTMFDVQDQQLSEIPRRKWSKDPKGDNASNLINISVGALSQQVDSIKEFRSWCEIGI
jgi:hypothetical protein